MIPPSFHPSTAAGTIPAMSLHRIAVAALAAVALAQLACGHDRSEKAALASAVARDERPRDRSAVAATVDGEEIGVDDVRALIDAADAGLGVDEAVEALIDERLLAREAARRGVGGADLDVERERALARRLIEEVRDGVPADTIDPKVVADAYQAQKARFVHGPLRRVVHAVARFKKRDQDDPAARAVAEQIRAAVGGATTEDEFRALAAPFAKRKDVAVKIESLPPFSAEKGRFVREFVDAAFAVPRVGGISPPFRTPFGWHVLFVAEELPAEDVSLEEARATLAAEIVPRERGRRLERLIERLASERGVFVYEAATEGRAAP